MPYHTRQQQFDAESEYYFYEMCLNHGTMAFSRPEVTAFWDGPNGRSLYRYGHGVAARFNLAELDADDAVAEALLAAPAKIAAGKFEYRGPGSVLAWLRGTVRNKLREAVRNHAKLVPMDEPQSDSIAIEDESAEELMISQQGLISVFSVIFEVLPTLSLEHRQAVILRWGGWSNDAIASLTGMKTGTAQKTCRRVFKRIHAMVSEMNICEAQTNQRLVDFLCRVLESPRLRLYMSARLAGFHRQQIIPLLDSVLLR